MKLDTKSPKDLATISELLIAANLVPVGLANENLHLFCARDAVGQIIGVVGVEVYSKGSLLRSLAVKDSMRNQGIARALLREAFQFAKSVQSYDLYLLTETIGDTMRRYGFKDIDRDQVPSDLLESPFFNGICPCSCQLMHKNIQEGVTK